MSPKPDPPGGGNQISVSVSIKGGRISDLDILTRPKEDPAREWADIREPEQWSR